MGRGVPVFWSFLLGSPLFIFGFYIHMIEILEIEEDDPIIGLTYPEFFGLPLMVFGLFIIIIGLYVQIVSPKAPTLRETEKILQKKHPSQRVARGKILISMPFLGVAVYLLEFTFLPYIYPTIPFLLGLYFISSGLYLYWRNTLTTYYVTNKRVISNYRFLSLYQKEIPHNKVRGIQENRSLFETLFRIGSITVASAGGGGTVNLKIRNIEDPSTFANEVRRMT